jgi:hypothetical protein
MFHSRLITLLQALSKEELKRFEAFLKSPYHNQSDKMLKFFRLIEPHHPHFTSKKLEKEKLFAALYDNRVYNDLTMRKTISELFGLLKSFIAIEQLQRESLQENEFRIKWFEKRNLAKLVDAEIESSVRLLGDYVKHNIDYYHHLHSNDLFKFERMLQHFGSTEHKLLKGLDTFAHVHSLNREYLINCLNFQHYFMALARIYRFSPDEELFDIMEALALKYVNKGDAVIDLWYNIFRLERTDEEKYFFELKTKLFANNPSVPQNVAENACVALENYTSRKIRHGEEKFASDAVQIYRFGIENNLYLEDGTMNATLYKNIVVRMVDTDEIDWVENFVQEYKKYLTDELREDSYNYALAHIMFARKRYKEALLLSLSYGDANPISKSLARFLVARTQYELEMFSELEVELDALRYQLKDKRFNPERKHVMQTFIDIMHQLVAIKSTGSYEMLDGLYLLLQQRNDCPNRKWFLTKMDELSATQPYLRLSARAKRKS